jgi:hypothetical protein
VTCPENAGEVVEFTVSGGKAVGRVVAPGAAARYGYQKGEEVFHVAVDPVGGYAGEVLWRGVAGGHHWDGIVLVASDTALKAIVTNEPCYRDMPRDSG